MAEALFLSQHGQASVVISDEMASDVTSNSCATTPASSTTNLDASNRLLEPEKQLQSIELESYIPLGCLISEASAASPRYPTWTEVHTVTLTERDVNRRLETATMRLMDARWIRVCAKSLDVRIIFRIHLLPDDIGQVQVARNSKHLRADLEIILSRLCPSARTWNGILEEPLQHFEAWATAEEGSLFYIFNTLQSPNPQPGAIKDRFTRLVVSELLNDPSSLPGLKTPLYPYQARSAAAMIQREASPGLHLDPRFEERTAPDGGVYYYSPRDLIFSQNPQVYESSRGGILAETMGLGWVICAVKLSYQPD
jgi:hypothetical protein